jgi:hypothetical protein
MKTITPQKLKKANNAAKCRMIKQIIRGEAKYKGVRS